MLTNTYNAIGCHLAAMNQQLFMLNVSPETGGRLNMKMSNQYRDPHVKDYKNPLHLNVSPETGGRLNMKTSNQYRDPHVKDYKNPLHLNVSPETGGRLNMKMSNQYRDPHVKDYKNPLHLDVVDRYLRRMGDKTIPDEAPPSLESFYPHESQVSIYHNQGVVDSLSRSPINTNKGAF